MSSKYPKKEIILNDKVEVIWDDIIEMSDGTPVSYTHLRAHET